MATSLEGSAEQLANIRGRFKAPPLGVFPRLLWLEDRLTAVREAEARYTEAGVPVPWNVSQERSWLEYEIPRERVVFRKVLRSTPKPFRIPDEEQELKRAATPENFHREVYGEHYCESCDIELNPMTDVILLGQRGVVCFHCGGGNDAK